MYVDGYKEGIILRALARLQGAYIDIFCKPLNITQVPPFLPFCKEELRSLHIGIKRQTVRFGTGRRWWGGIHAR